MPVEPATAERAEELVHNYEDIANQVSQATQRRGPGTQPRLVVVTKLKPSSDIKALYDHGVRHCGENYPQELEAKAKEASHAPRLGKRSWTLRLTCGPFLWRPIPNLFAIETLTSVKAANHLESTLSSLSPPRSTPLNIFIQINTSGEEQKAGLPALSAASDSDSSSSSSPNEVVDVAVHILTQCPHLRLRGLMTIGSFDSSTSAHPNPDFERLKETRTALLSALRGRDDVKDRVAELEHEAEGGLELSMGMSNDFVEAIEQGSTNVRVGSSIMGARPPRHAT
ncbi:hypothetical protein BMF94_6654 [Rhodotorula taiwanensis]|uniref:Pyridoxal phosphate homeostasis protein n=1 Tax=Rhodotorula taiwanensis TaxID=741276 RepID=A0A2S5B0S1_9BASI|nr:hypothetical protein BMF94_6654 [Rhodotorula taiwanensis]